MKRSALERDLRELVGDRASISGFERWFYRSDITHVPRAVRAMMRTTPDAVVCPADTAQVSAVVGYCLRQGLPLVPRGAGTSGLFGAVPKKGGVLLDLTDLSSVEGVDTEAVTVTAGAGATWNRVEAALAGYGLSLRSYPSSAPAATLGGWVMTSGLGIGSLKYGPVFGHVAAAEVVLPDGAIEQFRPDNGLETFFETEGRIGVVTRLTLRVRPAPEVTEHRLIAFLDRHDFEVALLALARSDPRPFNVEFQSAGYLALLRAAGYPVAAPSATAGVVLVSYDGSRSEVEAGLERLDGLCRQLRGAVVEGADHEWGQRFNMLRVKRAAPTVVPSSVYLPLAQLGRFASGLDRLDKRPLGTLGYLVSDGECGLMPMLATDQRQTLEYFFALQIPSVVSRLALSLGGRPGGGVGVWNAPYLKQIVGKERADEVRDARLRLDPHKKMNPGMWAEAPPLFRPTSYRLATGIVSKLDRLVPASSSGAVAEDYRAELDACVQCGNCMNVCPTSRGWLSSTPRGRVLSSRQWLDGGWVGVRGAADVVSRLYQCTLCGRCGVGCSVDIKSRLMWQGVRGRLGRDGLRPEVLDGLTTTIGETRNMSGKENAQRGNWVSRLKLPYDLTAKKTAEVVYFVGCVTSFFPMAQPAARAFARIMDAAGVDFTIAGGDEWCCGFPQLAAGDAAGAADNVRHNIARIRDIGAKTVVMTCPGCYRVWKEEYREVVSEVHGFDVLHSTEFIGDLIDGGGLELKELEKTVTYHDPCDLGRNSGIYQPPRDLLARIPGVEFRELAENREFTSCCGSGGDLLATNQELAMDIAGRKVTEILATGADTAVTACPSCVRAISMARTSARVVMNVTDVSELVWSAIQVEQ